jgi:hypothetical protein
MAPRPEEIMESKYRETLAAIQENCVPPPHPYLDPHRQGGLLLPLPTKTEVRHKKMLKSKYEFKQKAKLILYSSLH